MNRPIPIEDEKNRAQKQVRNTLLTFAITCALIRFVPIIVRKIKS